MGRLPRRSGSLIRWARRRIRGTPDRTIIQSVPGPVSARPSFAIGVAGCEHGSIAAEVGVLSGGWAGCGRVSYG